MPTYDPCPQSVHRLLAEVIDQYHGATLGEYKVTFDLLFAIAARDKEGISKGPAIKCLGHMVETATKISNAASIAAGHNDVQIFINYDEWLNADDATQRASLDEACERIEFVLDEDGEVEREGDEASTVTESNGTYVIKDNGRPKMRLRTPDFSIQGFWNVADRHKDALPSFGRAVAFLDEFPKQVHLHGNRRDDPVAEEGREADESRGDDASEAA